MLRKWHVPNCNFKFHIVCFNVIHSNEVKFAVMFKHLCVELNYVKTASFVVHAILCIEVPKVCPRVTAQLCYTGLNP